MTQVRYTPTHCYFAAWTLPPATGNVVLASWVLNASGKKRRVITIDYSSIAEPSFGPAPDVASDGYACLVYDVGGELRRQADLRVQRRAAMGAIFSIARPLP